MLCTFQLIGQNLGSDLESELQSLTLRYQLSTAQRTQVTQLLEQRNESIKSLALNKSLDEQQRAHKRSSFKKGFIGSVNLILNEQQRLISTTEQRKERIALIENLKQKGYSQQEIVNYFKKQ